MSYLLDIYARLLAQYGPRHWWPGDTPFEVCVGAILTQNTNWGNVEKAIANLKQADKLSVNAIATLPPEKLAQLIRPSGYYNVKARRLQEFTLFLRDRHHGSLERLFAAPWQTVRSQLLAISGIGPETADSILLYAGGQPSFVVDAYTRRIFSRLGLVPDDIAYEPLRHRFMTGLPEDTALFNEYHALIVQHGKETCRPTPRCPDCCLAALCNTATPARPSASVDALPQVCFNP